MNRVGFGNHRVGGLPEALSFAYRMRNRTRCHDRRFCERLDPPAPLPRLSTWAARKPNHGASDAMPRCLPRSWMDQARRTCFCRAAATSIPRTSRNCVGAAASPALLKGAGAAARDVRGRSISGCLPRGTFCPRAGSLMRRQPLSRAHLRGFPLDTWLVADPRRGGDCARPRMAQFPASSSTRRSIAEFPS